MTLVLGQSLSYCTNFRQQKLHGKVRKRGLARICFGISFSLKNHLQNRNQHDGRFLLPLYTILVGAGLCLGLTRDPKTLHPSLPKIIALGTMVNHYTQCNNIIVPM